MKPLWYVDVTYSIAIQVIAETRGEAERIACQVSDDIILDQSPDASANEMTESELKFCRTDFPFGIEEDLTNEEYYSQYQKWKKEEDKRIDLEKKQGKLF